MTRVLTDPTERRLRAARPDAADVQADAADDPRATAVMVAARQSAGPTVARARPRWVLRAAAVGALAAGVAVAGLQPGGDTGPQTAVARPIALAVNWFAPPAGTILHMRSTLVSESGDVRSSVTQELWQSTDDPARRRLASEQDGIRAESGPEGVYDPQTDTIYLPVKAPDAALDRALDRKLEAAKAAGMPPEKLEQIRDDVRKAKAAPSAVTEERVEDPIVAKVRMTLANGGARVAGRELHAGVDAHAIEVSPGAGSKARWTLWVAADDGRPLELRVVNTTEGVTETTTWDTYEVLPGDRADDVLGLRDAHPGARVVRDADAYEAAQARLYPKG